MIESDASGNGGVVGEEGIDSVLRLMMGEEDGRFLWLWELVKIDGPEVGCGGALALENGGAVESDVDGVLGMESGRAAMVAKLANGEQGAGGEMGEYVCEASGGWKMREIEGGGVCGLDGVTVGQKNGDAGIGRSAVGVRGVHVNVVAGAAGVDNAFGGNVGRRRWQGGVRFGGGGDDG